MMNLLNQRDLRSLLFGMAVCLAWPAPSAAHFQLIIPDRDIVTSGSQRSFSLLLFFAHPMEGSAMNMARPKRFGVSVRGGKPVDLLDTLKEMKVSESSAWSCNYAVKRPGDHVFFVEPQPYWEPSEDKFILHYAKVVVNAFGLEVGWDTELGLKMEIVPLVRPYGLWQNNLFRGIVKKDGRPLPLAEIEVQHYNQPGGTKLEAPTPAHVTQVIKSDANGVFAYTMPSPGWWGFAALTTAEKQLPGPDGQRKPVELGAVMWVRAYPLK